MAKTDHTLVWIDMEMTGLEPDRDRIIEIATLVTDGDMKVIAEGPDLVLHQPDPVLDGMDDWNRKHHGDSGLTARVRRSDVNEEQAEYLTLEFVRQYCPAKAVPLAGNSVWQDRRFLARYMPKLNDYLHHRIVDVSSVKELVRRWYPDVFAKAPSKKKSHRALDDIRESVEELRYYRETVFRP